MDIGHIFTMFAVAVVVLGILSDLFIYIQIRRLRNLLKRKRLAKDYESLRGTWLNRGLTTWAQQRSVMNLVNYKNNEVKLMAKQTIPFIYIYRTCFYVFIVVLLSIIIYHVI